MKKLDTKKLGMDILIDIIGGIPDSGKRLFYSFYSDDHYHIRNYGRGGTDVSSLHWRPDAGSDLYGGFFRAWLCDDLHEKYVYRRI